jgi:FAD/FMN-containing dehydrogenase
MQSVRRAIKRTGANVVYGTVRLIEAEEETLLRWARQDYACVIFNLLVEHTPDGLDQGKAQFQALIDCALNEGGSYYLTYHRWARRDQALRAYPEFPRFLRRKQHYDPRGLFDSDWHRHYRKMLL